MRKLTYEEIRQYINNLGLYLISDKYINAKSKLIISDKEGYYYFIDWNSIQQNNLSDKFIISNPYTIQNIRLWCKLNDKPFELLSEKYIGAYKKLKWKCLKEDCKEIFEMSWSDIFRSYNCPFCSGHKVGISNCLATKNPELASEWHPTKNGELTPYDVVCGCHKDVWWVCRECNYEWESNINNRYFKQSGCPECNKSKGEEKISNRFIDLGFIKISEEDYNMLDNVFKDKYKYYIPQKKFNGLIGIGGGLLSYDFYLPNLEFNFLIEYQGEFHDGSINKKSKLKQSKEDLEKQIKHDHRKRMYALQNNINLLEIWYWDFDNIETILDEYLNKSENENVSEIN